MVQVQVVNVDIGMVIYKAMTLQCLRSVIKVIKLDIGNYHTPLWKVIDPGPGRILEW